jgi:hypothetical protein
VYLEDVAKGRRLEPEERRTVMKKIGACLLIAQLFVGSACSTSSFGTGGPDGGGGGGGGGGYGTGGSGGCGPCPGYACMGMTFNVAAEADASVAIANLTASSPGLTVTCYPSGTGYQCSAAQAADGDHTITFSAPGFDPGSTVVHVTNPTDCGCCGCCPFSTSQQITLHPNGKPAGGCSDASAADCG